jgi:hypothetical protein
LYGSRALAGSEGDFSLTGGVEVSLSLVRASKEASSSSKSPKSWASKALLGLETKSIKCAQHNPAVLLDKSLRPDVFCDFSNSDSYVEMFNKVCEAKSAFEDLPSEVRSKFRNDPKRKKIQKVNKL